MKYEGKTWTYGDNIDTDVIIPARYLNSFDPKELASHCMVDIDESFAKEVKAGDIMVGGWNFGCGSSREHAPIAIKASGVPVILSVDISTGTIADKTTGDTFKAPPLPDFIQGIASAGGLIAYVKEHAQ